MADGIPQGGRGAAASPTTFSRGGSTSGSRTTQSGKSSAPEAEGSMIELSATLQGELIAVLRGQLVWQARSIGCPLAALFGVTLTDVPSQGVPVYRVPFSEIWPSVGMFRALRWLPSLSGSMRPSAPAPSSFSTFVGVMPDSRQVFALPRAANTVFDTLSGIPEQWRALIHAAFGDVTAPVLASAILSVTADRALWPAVTSFVQETHGSLHFSPASGGVAPLHGGSVQLLPAPADRAVAVVSPPSAHGATAAPLSGIVVVLRAPDGSVLELPPAVDVEQAQWQQFCRRTDDPVASAMCLFGVHNVTTMPDVQPTGDGQPDADAGVGERAGGGGTTDAAAAAAREQAAYDEAMWPWTPFLARAVRRYV
ncbi:hypothetical protein EON62_06030, partial [archaeon]